MNTTERLEKQEIGHAKKGLLYGVASGASWGLSGVIMSIAFGMAPFTEGVSLLLHRLLGQQCMMVLPDFGFLSIIYSMANGGNMPGPLEQNQV